MKDNISGTYSTQEVNRKYTPKVKQVRALYTP